MRTSPKALPRIAALVTILGGGSLLLGSSVVDSLAQETKCYLMVCTGSVCVARQITCPTPLPTETPTVPET